MVAQNFLSKMQCLVFKETEAKSLLNIVKLFKGRAQDKVVFFSKVLARF